MVQCVLLGYLILFCAPASQLFPCVGARVRGVQDHREASFPQDFAWSSATCFLTFLPSFSGLCFSLVLLQFPRPASQPAGALSPQTPFHYSV